MAQVRAARIRSANDERVAIDCACGQLLAWRLSDGTIVPECRQIEYRPDNRVILKCGRCGSEHRTRAGWRNNT
jgi:RNase P subunit RPR2